MVQPWSSKHNPVPPAINYIINFVNITANIVYTIRARLFPGSNCLTKTDTTFSYESCAQISSLIYFQVLPSYTHVSSPCLHCPPRHSQNVCTRIVIRITKSVIRRILSLQRNAWHTISSLHTNNAKQNKYANTVPAKHPYRTHHAGPKKNRRKALVYTPIGCFDNFNQWKQR
jgi:hypothetical protein